MTAGVGHEGAAEGPQEIAGKPNREAEIGRLGDRFPLEHEDVAAAATTVARAQIAGADPLVWMADALVDRIVVIADSHRSGEQWCPTCGAIRDALAASVVVLWQTARRGEPAPGSDPAAAARSRSAGSTPGSRSVSST